MPYDIFISYKHDKSQATANNLYNRLKQRGYATFLDATEMPPGNYDTRLFEYIEKAKDVFVILEEGSLDSCKSDNWRADWFCQEITYALKSGKNIIPVLVGGYRMPQPAALPKELTELSLKNAPEFSFVFFDQYLDLLASKGYITAKPRKRLFKKLATCGILLFTGMAVVAATAILHKASCRIDSTSTVAEVEKYRPDFIESLLCKNRYERMKSHADSLVGYLKTRYDITIDKSITIGKLNTLAAIMDNMSYTCEYPDTFDSLIDSIYIGKFEVSIDEWNAFMDSKRKYTQGDLPIADVTAGDALMFADTLAHYTGKHFALPTKRQWEEFARANETYRYAGDNNPKATAWFADNSNGTPHSRRELKKGNRLDLFNICGNVSEMCASDTVIHGKRNFIVKGGSYNSFRSYLSIYFDDYIEQKQKSPAIGFRIIINK